MVQITELNYRLLGTNGFHGCRGKGWKILLLGCRQNRKKENFTSSFGRLRQNISPKSAPHVQHDSVSSFNQSNHWFVALLLPSPFLKLSNVEASERSHCYGCLPSRTDCFETSPRQKIRVLRVMERLFSSRKQVDWAPLSHKKCLFISPKSRWLQMTWLKNNA